MSMLNNMRFRNAFGELSGTNMEGTISSCSCFFVSLDLYIAVPPPPEANKEDRQYSVVLDSDKTFHLLSFRNHDLVSSNLLNFYFLISPLSFR